MAHPKYNLEVFQTEDSLAIAAAQLIISVATASIRARGRFVISLSGGETPKKLYDLLSQPPFCEQIQWDKTFIFWGDERCVPLNDERNNAYQARLILLDKVAIPESNIYTIPVNLPAIEAASKYASEINDFFGNNSFQFDLILLGLGINGHTASLFPGTEVLDERVAGVRALFVEDEGMYRITLTAPLINQAHTILFMVTGKEKANILKEILTGASQPDKYPAQLIKPTSGGLFWYVDSPAASLLTI
jgi:6-phosphogluconolactonase